jgi:hypothetical protein
MLPVMVVLFVRCTVGWQDKMSEETYASRRQDYYILLRNGRTNILDSYIYIYLFTAIQPKVFFNNFLCFT